MSREFLIRIAKAAPETSKRGFFLPMKMPGPVTTIEEELPIRMYFEFTRNPFVSLLDNGQVYTIGQNSCEVTLVGDEFEFHKKSLPFDIHRFECILFTNDLRICFGFNVDSGGKSIKIVMLKSSENLFESPMEKIFCRETSYTHTEMKELARIQHLDISRNMEYLVIMYTNQYDNVLCDILRFVDHESEGILLIPYYKVDMTLISFFPVDTRFDHDESFCLFHSHINDCVVVSLEQKKLLFVPPPESRVQCTDRFDCSVIEHIQLGVLLIRGIYSYQFGDLIEIFQETNGALARIKLLGLPDLGLDPIKSFIVRKRINIKIFSSHYRYVSVVDPFKEVVLQIFNFDRDFFSTTISANSFGTELFVRCYDKERGENAVILIDTDYNNEISMKSLVKRFVLCNFSPNQLKMVNIPVALKYELAVV